MIAKNDCRDLLRICMKFVKLNYFIQTYKLSQSAISRFINYDNYEMISNDTLNKLCEEIYNTCCAYKDCYEDAFKKGA